MRSPEETKALVDQNSKLIDRIAALVAERAKALADLEVCRRIVASAVIHANRDGNGEPCWCLGLDLMRHIGQPSHEPGCHELRSLTSKLVAALEVEQ